VVAALQHAATALPWPGRVAAASALGKARGTWSKQSLLLDHFNYISYKANQGIKGSRA